MPRKTVSAVRKRDGREVPFNEEKIAKAIFKAAKAVGGQDRKTADRLAARVAKELRERYSGRAPTIEEIQDVVEKVLIESGHARTAKAYILYRAERSKKREMLRVRKESAGERDSTDMLLLVEPSSREELLQWDKARISRALVKEAGLKLKDAEEISDAVEERIFKSGIKQISTALIRELVDNELFERGEKSKLDKQAIIGMPKYDLDQIIFSKSAENSNVASNNPEAVNLAIAENTLKQYALDHIFSKGVSDAHKTAAIHLHDLGYPTRVYCSGHSLEYIKKYGLRLINLSTSSKPAKHAGTLTGHLNTFLASMQAYYAGALGIGFVNIFYAPYLENATDEQMKQEAQYLIYSCSQNAFSRGGQTLFIDFNVHLGVPEYIKKTRAIGPRGGYTGKTYGDYEETAQRFLKAMLDVWREGDSEGRPFPFPKLDLHVDARSFTDPKQRGLLDYACQIAAENGSTYFVFDRDEVTLAQCCRLRTTIEDRTVLDYPERIRFCGFQNVTINLPQAAYRAGKGNIDGAIKEVEKTMDIAMKAHLEKRKFIEQMMSNPAAPLWQVGKVAEDGQPYIDLDQATYIIGIMGLNEMVEHLTGKALHESDDAYKLGLRIISAMYIKAKQFTKEHKLKVSLEESPAESAALRLAKVDLQSYPESANYIRGDKGKGHVYYTNSIHFEADADIDITERIEKQGKFNTLIESGCITHVFLGEQKPSTESIFNIVKKTWDNTQSAQITISPEFTFCEDCKRISRGFARTRDSSGSPGNRKEVK